MDKETKYPTAVLLKSKALAEYQQDFARVLLTKREYSVKEARAVLDQFLNRKGSEANGRRKLEQPE